MSIVQIERRSLTHCRSGAAGPAPASRRRFRIARAPVWVLAFSALRLAWSAPALAATAAPHCNPDCPKGTTCELIGQPCLAILCADPDDPRCRCDSAPVSSCVPAACQTDSDCADNMACFERLDFSSCPAAQPTPTTIPRERGTQTAQPPEPASASAPAECTTTTVKECILRSQLPCTTAADCGTGFVCEQGQTCRAPAAPSGAHESTECQPEGPSACQLIEMACELNADCPAEFVCLELNGMSCSLDSDGQTRCEPSGPPKQCIPRLDIVPNGILGDASAVGSVGATPATLTTADLPYNEARRASEGGHCSIGYARAPNTAGVAVLSVLGLATAFGWRRRREGAHRDRA